MDDALCSWATLPDHILVMIYRQLSFKDRFSCAQVCSSWSLAFETVSLWRRVIIHFRVKEDERFLIMVRKYSDILRDITLKIDQSIEDNRLNACRFLYILHERERGDKTEGITHLKIEFIATNPLFYTGNEFVDSLKMLFAREKSLKSVDLGSLHVLLDTEVIDILTENNRQLEYLNTENKTIISHIQPSSTHNLATRCNNLRELIVFYSCLSNNVLSALSECKHLLRLSVMSRRSEKFGVDLESEYWGILGKKLPMLRVCMKFDSTCPVNIINGILKPEIPANEVRLEIYCHVHEQLNHAVAMYSDTLEVLVVNTPSLKEFDDSLLNAIRECRRLHTLLIYCRLPEEVIAEIFATRPDIKQRGSYILKSRADVEDLWVVGREYDEI